MIKKYSNQELNAMALRAGRRRLLKYDAHIVIPEIGIPCPCYIMRNDEKILLEYGRADLLSYNFNTNILRILEIKVNLSDFRHEIKTNKYNKVRWFADYYTFLLPVGMLPNDEYIPEGIGVQEFDHNCNTTTRVRNKNNKIERLISKEDLFKRFVWRYDNIIWKRR